MKKMHLERNMEYDRCEILHKRTSILKNLAFNFTAYSYHWFLLYEEILFYIQIERKVLFLNNIIISNKFYY